MIIVGTYLLNSTSDFYHEDFVNQMDKFFSEQDFQNSNYSMEQLGDKIKTYTIQLGIDSFRNYYIFDKKGDMLLSSSNIDTNFEYTPNLISALNSENGRKVNTSLSYVDYGVPVLDENDELKYVIYIKDTKEELKRITSRINRTIFYSVLLGILISVGLGFLLSNTITTPIIKLTKNAEKLARGNFKEKIDVMSTDEIGKLTNTFNNMATELKDNMEHLASEKNMMEAILINMTDGLIAFNLEGKIIHANPAAMKMLRIENKKDIIFDVFFKSLDIEISLGELIYLDNWNTIEKEINIDDFVIKAFFVPFKVEGDKAGGVVTVLQDITNQQKLELSRREFVANVSHELKTPLTSIKSYAETLLGGAIDDKSISTQFLTVINSESDRMTRLVKDLLLLSNLDNNKGRWNMKYFLLKNSITEIVERFKITSKETKHNLELFFTTEIPEIYGDKDRIEQVLINIISNAIKYTPDGGNIKVYSGRIFDEVYVKVIDNGIGIPKKDLDRIFERFYRVDKARSRNLGGSGLGLAIAKEIMEAHKGSINVKSEHKKGTEVTITFPVPEM
jgi:two-component system sensor histidine kinase VicK